MTIVHPNPTPRYGPPPVLGVTTSAGGFLATCVCRWLRWWPDEKAAATGYTAHVLKCKAHGEVAS